METIRGFKGFDRDLVCLKFQYEIGKVYKIDESPKLCERGFHFSPTLKQAMKFYPDKNGNRWCEIKALGVVDVGDGKCVTNEIEIVREITKDDLCAEFEGINLALLRDVARNGGIICGSLALKLQGFDLGRPIKDIDFIFIDNKDVNLVFKTYEIAQQGSVIIENKGIQGRRSFYDKEYNKTYDVFIKNETYREIVYYGEKLRVSDPLKIWNEKLRYAFSGTPKHAKDFYKFKHRLSFTLIIKDSNTLNNEILEF